MKRSEAFWRPLLCGVFIGGLGVAPGVSGGALAASFGYYALLLFAAAHPIKAVKTASSAFVPMVGRTLADSLDSVMGLSLLLKNAIGLVGALAILLACAMPALRIWAQSLIFRLASALVQTLGENQLSDALAGMGKSLTQLFAVLAMCGLFGFFTFALMVGLGNLTMMMR